MIKKSPENFNKKSGNFSQLDLWQPCILVIQKLIIESKKCLRLGLFMANLKHKLNVKRKIENISVITEKNIFTLNITRKF